MSLNLSAKREIKGLLQRYGVYPSKKFGQNFLIDRLVSKKFLKAADLKSGDIVLEIGPGIGNLTREIAKKVRRVIAVEKDPKMCQILKETLKDSKNVEVIQGDILKIPNTKYKIQNTSYKVVANLPFYLAAPVIRKFLELVGIKLQQAPKEMIFFVQKEVAQRITARPPKMNLLAILVQFYAKPEIISYVSKKSFWPQPKVDGAILRIAPLINADRKLINVDLFFQIVRAGFSQPRKQLTNNLTKKLGLGKETVITWLKKNKIQPSQRPETLEIDDWIRLTQSFIKPAKRAQMKKRTEFSSTPF